MLALTETLLPADLLRPRSLAMLIGIYECNYRRLIALLGEPFDLPPCSRLRLRGRPLLYIDRRAQSRYTLELRLAHLFAGERLPDLRVRLYRDARLAEALAPAPCAGNDPLADLPARWRANLLLYKWLEYCLDSRRKANCPAPALARAH